jgi:hypothetical protein
LGKFLKIRRLILDTGTEGVDNDNHLFAGYETIVGAIGGIEPGF